jgi:hypothetical protein
MTRVEFRLTMPGARSWNGRWSGEGRDYLIVRSMPDAAADSLIGEQSDDKSWFHNWSDGWTACVTARRMVPGERAKKSAGFAGYDWMVANILAYGQTAKPEPVTA